jgi:chromosome segregation ATPase
MKGPNLNQLTAFVDNQLGRPLGWLGIRNDAELADRFKLGNAENARVISRLWIAIALQKTGAIPESLFQEFAKALHATDDQIQSARDTYSDFYGQTNMARGRIIQGLIQQEKLGQLAIALPAGVTSIGDLLREEGETIEEVLANWWNLERKCAALPPQEAVREELRQQLAELQSEKERLKVEMEKLQRENERLRGEVADLKERLKSTRIPALESQIAEQRREISQLQRMNSALESQLQRERAQRGQLEAQLQEKEAELAALQQENEDFKEETAKLQQENQALEKEVADLKVTVERLKSPLPWVLVGILAALTMGLAGMLWVRKA